MEPKTKWEFKEGSWKDLLEQGIFEDLGEVPLEDIGLPWSYNVHIHLNYDRLFWDVWERGVKTPLLVRPWSWPPKGDRQISGCRPNGYRMDNTPIFYSTSDRKYELLIGNMRYVAAFVCGHKSLRTLLLESDEKIEKIWEKYHPVFEGNWYDHPEYQLKTGGTVYVKD